MSHQQQTAAVFAGLARNARGTSLKIPELDMATVTATAAHELTSSSRRTAPTPPRTTAEAQPTKTILSAPTTMAPPSTTQTFSSIPTTLLEPRPGSYPPTTSSSCSTSSFMSFTLHGQHGSKHGKNGQHGSKHGQHGS